MKYLELLERLSDATHIRRAEELKSILGGQIELVGTINQVHESYISIIIPANPLDQYALGTLIGLERGTEQRFKRQLMECSFGDEVRIIAEVTKSEWPTSLDYEFKLLSMSTLSTTASREIERIANERKRLEAAEAARVAAAPEMKRRRRNAASKENAGTGAGIGAAIGGIVMGLSGCASCLNHLPPPGHLTVPPFNLFTGLLFGAIGGAVIGAVLGITIGQMKD